MRSLIRYENDFDLIERSAEEFIIKYGVPTFQVKNLTKNYKMKDFGKKFLKRPGSYEHLGIYKQGPGI
jgi:hypothetical protein